MNKNILVVTGKIKSGKTTRLFTFSSQQKSIDGILSPIINGKRILYHIGSRTIKEFEVTKSDEIITEVGNYKFLQSSFDWGNKKLIESNRNNPEWLIVDEVGKLELQRKGLYSSIIEILKNRNNYQTKIILVIRDYLLVNAIKYFNIQKDEYEIFDI